MTAANAYSPTWFETFLLGYSPSQTEAEITFLARHLPLPTYRTVLDLCCGTGRHALPLAQLGYEVTGVDQNPYALAEATRNDPTGKVLFIQGDMRDLSSIPGIFDAALILWQSFGYFDPETNANVLRQIHRKLRPGGRFVLDIYHRAFFEAHQGERTFSAGDKEVTESKRMVGDRLHVTLDYGHTSPPDSFEWQIYTPEEMCTLAGEVGFGTLMACTGFDESIPPSPRVPRMQFVFEKQQP